MQINWGTNSLNNSAVIWDDSRVINAHMAIFGDSGMGKTFQLRKVIASLLETCSKTPRFHIFDAHGDIEIGGESAVRFHESADYGFNPLELNADPEFGGVRKRIQSIIMAINRTSVRLGPRQERALTKLLTGLYKNYGFYAEDSSTWALDGANRKVYPTLLDAIEYGREIVKAMYTGSNQKAIQALEEVNRLAKQIANKESILLRVTDDSGVNRLDKELEKAKQKAIDAYTEAVLTITTGEELDDAIEFEGQDETMKSIMDRLENLYAIGIYRSTPPPLDPRNPVWRYIITSLSQDEKKLFTMTRLETIFTRAVQRGPQEYITDVIILDEAHLYQDKDDDYIVNKMVREARKFGVAMIFASQGLKDFSDTLIAGLGTKIILGIDRAYRNVAISKFGLSEANMDFIVPWRRIVIQIKNKGELNTTAHMTMLSTD